MSYLFFTAAVVFFILWITKKDNAGGDVSGYSQGYWDGYRALGKKIQAHLGKGNVDKKAIQQEINVGFGGVAPEASESETSSETIPESVPVAHSVSSIEYYQRQQTPEAVEAKKAEQSLKNLNILLFVASLLFVAAGAAFVAAAMPDGVKLFGVWLLTAAFYGVGMALQSSTRLKAAGTAFVGTSLGLIPFAGVALYQLGGVPGAAAWCITSLIATVAYFVAAFRLQSQVVSYLTLAFVVSFASSFAESVSLPIVWNFVILIGVSLAFSLLAQIKQAWVPKLFLKPVELTGQLVTPLAIFGSLVLADRMSLRDYEIVFGIATLHYAAAFVQMRQFVYETLVRILGHLTLLLVVWDVVTGDRMQFGLAFLAFATLQEVYSLLRYNKDRGQIVQAEWMWLHIMQFFQFCSVAFWTGLDGDALLSSLAFGLLGLSSAAATFRFRNAGAAISGLFASVVLPFIIARGVIIPPLAWAFVAVWFVAAAGAVVGGYYMLRYRSKMVRAFFVSSFATYATVAGLISFGCGAAWEMVILLALTAVIWTASYVMKKPLAITFASVTLFVAVLVGWDLFHFDSTWQLLGTTWVSAALFYGGYAVFRSRHDHTRSLGLIVSTWVVLAIGALVTFFDSELKIFAALTVVLGAATVGIEGYLNKNKAQLETGIYIGNFGLQRLLGIVFPELNMVFYAHWWALVIALVAWWRRQLSTRLIVAMAFVTFASGVYALGEGGMYQLLFLVEHLALLVAGVLASKRWAIWWGLVASCLAILYFLKDFAFLAFGFLGLVIIAIVVWRLMKLADHQEKQG